MEKAKVKEELIKRYKYIYENLMYTILHTVEKHLPYLEDADKKEDDWLKHIKIEGKIVI